MKRKEYLDTKWKRVIEVVLLVAVTATFMYFAPMFLKDDCIYEDEQ